jgi:hypothetical protein
VFQRLALPTPVSISNGMYSGCRRLSGQRPFWWRRTMFHWLLCVAEMWGQKAFRAIAGNPEVIIVPAVR